MSVKQKLVTYITTGLLIVPLFTVTFLSPAAQAYKCTGATNNQQHYYKDGACYQPVGNVCLDSPAPATPADCKNRDTSKDTKVVDEKPVKNDGSEITEWECSTGKYNATKSVCETCNAFGACTTNTKVTPTPTGDDKTVDPDTEKDENADDKTSSKTGECAGEKTDYFACDGDGADAIVSILKIVILIVSIGVGIVAVGGLVYGAILYASAQDNQEQIQKAIKVIRGIIVGLLLYVFMVAILNFLVPGGVFGSTPEQTENPTNGNSDQSGNGNTNTNTNTNGTNQNSSTKN